MKKWMWAYIYALVILISACLVALAYHISVMQVDLENMREELVVTTMKCNLMMQDIERWERLNDESLRLLSEGGWECLKQ